jgi:multicomponent Na+:H+ antiporter subunit E
MRFVWTTAVLGAMWCLLSGKFDALHLGIGLAGSALVAGATLRWRSPQAVPLGRLLMYVPWLLGEVIKSNLRVARLVLSRRMPISPRFVRLSPGLVSDRAMTLLGCSITLTPGTVTVDMERQQMLVHALDEVSASDLQAGEMSRRVRRVFAATEGKAVAQEGEPR